MHQSPLHHYLPTSYTFPLNPDPRTTIAMNILDINDHDDSDDGDDHDDGDDGDDGDDCLNQFYNLASMSERPNFQTTRFSSSHTLLLPCSVKFHLDDRDHHNDQYHR